MTSAFISIRGSTGVRMAASVEATGTVPKFEEVGPDVFKHDQTKNCKVFCFDPAGSVFAWSDGNAVNVVKLIGDRWTSVCQIPHAKVSFMTFSPMGNVLATWEVLATKKGQDAPHNLQLWDPRTGAKVGSFTQKRSSSWRPQWSADEKVCCLRSPNNEAFFYKDNDFSTVDCRLSISKMDTFSLSPGDAKNCHIVCFVPGQKGGPGFGKLYTHPNFHPEKDVVASKSFFQSDHMETEWSADGRMVLLLTQSEVDKTGGSYYGKQQLHFASSSGDTAMVQLAKEGPIYSIQWNPTAPQFCVVYGYMPAKATLYSHKCEKIFDFGTGSRNMAMFNAQGSLLLLGGFGNLRGAIEVWSVTDKKRVSEFEATDSTDIKFSPIDGQRILTSTCAPRLRQGNGYKVWHYTGSLLHEKPLEDASQELWEVQWQNSPSKPQPFKILYKKVEGIAPKQPQASKVAYRPPGMRAKPGATFKLHDEDEPAENAKKNDGEALSKSAAKNKKRREAAKKKKEEEENSTNAAQAQAAPAPAGPLSDKDKKLRKLNDKLTQIKKLKQQQKEGKTLEINQLDKIKKESEILKEIEMLKL